MKRETIHHNLARVLLLAALFVAVSVQALAYDAGTAAQWMEQFAQALSALSPVNDPQQTADPARAGEYLLEYEFGTVRCTVSSQPKAQDILEVDVRSSQVTDCRGVRVGMALGSALENPAPAYGAAPLCVLDISESNYGWSWAYAGEEGIYGVEYIAYGEGAAGIEEYTLTYVIEHDVITAIRIKRADSTIAHAQDGHQTAQEIAARQMNDLQIAANTLPALTEDDLRIMGSRALGVPVEQLIAVMGEPQQIQTLPQGTGRVLIYNGAVVTLGFNEMTGEEIVRAVSVSSDAFEGPNRLKVGMTLREAGGHIRCDQNVYSRGGLLYLEGEALGEAPYGELRNAGHEMMLLYACAAQADTALLQAISVDGTIVSWQLMYQSDLQDGV